MSTGTRRALYGKLSGDTTLTGMLGVAGAGYTKAIYHDVAPEDSGFPFVVFSKSSGTPVSAYGNPAVFDNDVWLVKAVDRNTTADGAEALAARVDTLLQDATLSISGATLVYLRRMSDVQFPETVDGVEYKHCGALYRLVTTA